MHWNDFVERIRNLVEQMRLDITKRWWWFLIAPIMAIPYWVFQDLVVGVVKHVAASYLPVLSSLIAGPWLAGAGRPISVFVGLFLLVILGFFIHAYVEVSQRDNTPARPPIEGQIYRVWVGGKSMYADTIRDFYKTVRKDEEFEIDVDILIEMYAVNTTNNTQHIRGFDFTAEIDGKVLPLVLQRDFYAYELNDIHYEYCLNLSSNKLDNSKLETLRPLYQSLPVELEARKPLEGWVHFVIKKTDPEKVFKNRTYKFLIVDSLDKEHQILKSVMDEREGAITIRPIITRPS